MHFPYGRTYGTVGTYGTYGTYCGTCTYGTYGTYLRYGTVPYSLDLLYPGITRIVKLKMKLGDF